MNINKDLSPPHNKKMIKNNNTIIILKSIKITIINMEGTKNSKKEEINNKIDKIIKDQNKIIFLIRIMIE
jgi:hypothetical protein